MQTQVVIRDMRGEESFELSGDLTSRQIEHLGLLAEQVAHDTGWGVTITTEEQA